MSRVWHGFLLLDIFAKDLVVSTIQVMVPTFRSQQNWTPGLYSTPVPSDLSDEQLTLLAHMVSATPGTLTVRIDEDRRLLLHLLDASEEALPCLERDLNHLSRRIQNVL